jgi:hypothetical protein
VSRLPLRCRWFGHAWAFQAAGSDPIARAWCERCGKLVGYPVKPPPPEPPDPLPPDSPRWEKWR